MASRSKQGRRLPARQTGAPARAGSVEADAAIIDAHLRSIRQRLKEALLDESRRWGVGLTAPQLLLLEAVVERTRSGGMPLGVRELSERIGLSHSTVSGIVDRLEAAKILVRTVRTDDRRIHMVELAAPAKSWIEEQLPKARERPLASALARAKAQQRRVVIEGLATLEELLTRSGAG